MKNTILLVLLCISILACEKAETTRFKGGQGISFFQAAYTPDSLNYSFANNVTTKSEDTIWVRLSIMGNPVDYDRVVLIGAAEQSTAVKGINFDLPECILPAHAFEARYPVVIYNTADLSTKTYRLVLKVLETEDFVQGAVGRRNDLTVNTTFYKINFNNQLIKPAYWIYVQSYFGDYSNVKYKFIIETLGRSDFLPDTRGGTMSYSQGLNYRGRMNTALQDYEKLHGTLVDENGKAVTFPL